jgi:MOSC domain-containing protein YiiM
LAEPGCIPSAGATIRLCEPCRHLEQVTGQPVRAGLVHRGGLRAQIVTGGTIRVADSIEVIEPA